MLGGFMPRCAGFNHLDNALTQVTGARLWHRHPPRSRINAATITHSWPFGNPPDSTRPGTALVWLLVQKSATRLARRMMRTSEPPQ
jgi:hypothetical protein